MNKRRTPSVDHIHCCYNGTTSLNICFRFFAAQFAGDRCDGTAEEPILTVTGCDQKTHRRLNRTRIFGPNTRGPKDLYLFSLNSNHFVVAHAFQSRSRNKFQAKTTNNTERTLSRQPQPFGIYVYTIWCYIELRKTDLVTYHFSQFIEVVRSIARVLTVSSCTQFDYCHRRQSVFEKSLSFLHFEICPRSINIFIEYLPCNFLWA